MTLFDAYANTVLMTGNGEITPRRALARCLLAALLATSLAVVTGAAPAGAAPPVPTIRAKADLRGLQIGTAVRAAPLSADPRYGPTLRAEFNAVTPETGLTWRVVHPQRGVYDWAEADAVFAVAGMHRYGQPLVSGTDLPAWLTDRGHTAAELRAILREHVQTVVRRYAGRVGAWTVVDRPLADSIWLRRLGPGYVAEALRWAREADPQARLYVADRLSRSAALARLLGGLTAIGVPVDGAALTAQLTVGEVPHDLAATLSRFTARGLAVRISELEVRLPGPATAELLAAQAADYAAVTVACRQTAGCVGFTVWGLTDAYAPAGGDPVLLTATYGRKPAWTAVLNALIGFPDVEPPTGASLRVGSVVGDTATLLAGGSDNNFVYAADLYRDGALLVSQVDNASFTVRGLAPGTHVFTVVLRDPAGNRSTPSAPVTVTVGAGSPAPTGVPVR